MSVTFFSFKGEPKRFHTSDLKLVSQLCSVCHLRDWFLRWDRDTLLRQQGRLWANGDSRKPGRVLGVKQHPSLNVHRSACESGRRAFPWRWIMTAIFHPLSFLSHNQDLAHSQIFKMQLRCRLMLCESGRCSTQMAQDNSSGHRFDAGADSDIQWAAGENNTRQGAGMLILGSGGGVGHHPEGKRGGRAVPPSAAGEVTWCWATRTPDADGRRRPDKSSKLMSRGFFFSVHPK